MKRLRTTQSQSMKKKLRLVDYTPKQSNNLRNKVFRISELDLAKQVKI